MSNYDSAIETAEQAIAALDLDVDYHRLAWGNNRDEWVEWADYASLTRARFVNYQTVLFAIREGY